MLNRIERIQQAWPASVLGLDEAAYLRFIEDETDSIRRRLTPWVGAEAVADAALETPENPDRAADLRDAELNLLHISCINHIANSDMAQCVSGFRAPSGLDIRLDFSSRQSRADATLLYSDTAHNFIERWRV